MSYIYKLSEDVAPSLREVFEERGWVEWNSEKHKQNEWNILWTTKRYFTTSSSYSLSAFQKLNHFKRTSQITKKDNLTRNIKRMRANFGKTYSFYPKSYQFPLQYSEFVTMIKKRNSDNNNNISSSLTNDPIKYKRHSLTRNKSIKAIKASLYNDNNYYNSINSSIWIAKPASGRRGENITLFTDVSKLQYSQPMIIQKYISNPLLIGGYKFDLRIYVLITSFRPLEIYCYNDGLCRFSTQIYDIKNIDNIYSHLTNSSVNKKSNTFTKDKNVIGAGCKWTINKLLKYIQHEIIDEKQKKINIESKIWNQIHDIIILTVLPIIMDVEQCSNCFELFGFDILIDNKYNCWLLEVNGSPAIAINSDVDKMVKKPMLNHCIDCIESQFGFVMPNKKNTKSRRSSTSSSILSSRSSNNNTIDIEKISRELLGLDLDGSKESKCDESEDKSIETMDSKDNNDGDDKQDLFRNNFGGFEQIFPFNANTFESNKVLMNMTNSMISRAQKFKTIVVKEIKKRRRDSNK